MNSDEMRVIFQEYAQRAFDIRRLSSPSITKEDTADNYSERLQGNFRKIGELAAVNRRMLDELLYPLLESDDELDKAVAEDLNELSEMLLNIASVNDDFENLDLPIASLITGRLLADAERKNDINERIKRMDAEMVTCYSMMNMTDRISTQPAFSKVYFDKGMALGEEFMRMLDKDTFLGITDPEMREMVLVNARFTACFFDSCKADDEMNRLNLEMLDKTMEVADDEFYHEAVPDFDWNYHRFRCLEYYLQSAEVNNAKCFSIDQLEKIEKRSHEMEELLKSNPEYFKEIPSYPVCPLYYARAHFLAGNTDKEEYRKVLTDMYEARDDHDFGFAGTAFNVLIPLELMCLVDKENMSSCDMHMLRGLYQDLVAYLFRAPNTGTLSFVLEYYSQIIDRFIDVPSGIDFEDFVMQCIAAIHPPTYVHSHMEGQISECLCYHLLRTEPERFIGFPGCETIDDVLAKKDEILHYTYHATLCHDFGKIKIIDTIFVYGRKLLDLEFNIIRAHPVMGAELLAAHQGTRTFADVARGHHRWHNDKGGYPEDFKTVESPYKIILDLALCADCMDAATDVIGRSYNKGKTLQNYIDELKEGAGTRYAAWLPALLERKEVFEDVQYLLTRGREDNYRDTYRLLRGVQEKVI